MRVSLNRLYILKPREIKMLKVGLNQALMAFKGQYAENLPNKRDLDRTLEEGKSKGIYNDATSKELEEFRQTIRDITEKQTPQKDIVVFNLYEPDNPNKDKDLEQLGTTVSYYSPALDGKNISDEEVPIVCQNGLKQILDNKDLVTGIIKERAKQSKEAESK